MSAVRKPRKRDEATRSNLKTAVPAVEQAARVLLCLATSPHSKMRLTDICDQVEIAKSKGHAILNTLAQFELVEKDPQAKTYTLGPALIFLSQRVLENLSYPEIVAPFLEDLAAETNATVAFGLISDTHVFVIAKREGNQNIGFRLPLGRRFHITLGAHGKAIVAFMDQAERDKLLAKKNIHFYGDGSVIDMQRLRAELAQCRALGYAEDIGEVTPGVSVVSTPVFGIRERMVGCLLLIGTFEASKTREFGPKVVSAAKLVSHKLGAHTEAIYPR